MLNKLNKRTLIKLYIQNHPGASITETAKETGCSRAMVSVVRKELQIEGNELPPSRSVPQDELVGMDGGDSPDNSETFADVITRVLSGQGLKLTAPQQAQVFSELAIHPKAHPSTRISALNGLRALEATAQQTADLGPGPPLTREDRLHRLSLLIEACGMDLSREAFLRAFPFATAPIVDPMEVPVATPAEEVPEDPS